MNERDRLIDDLLAHSAWEELSITHSAATIIQVRAILAKSAKRAKSGKTSPETKKPFLKQGSQVKFGKLLLQTDGGSAGNPGPSGGGGVLVDSEGQVVESFSVFFGEGTNNEAEYKALIEGLDRALALAPEELDIRIDSELLVKQIQGKYKVRKEHLRPLYYSTMERLAHLKYTIAHVPRAQNAEADNLATLAIQENR